MDGLTTPLLATLLVSLRIAPVFAFAPPFTLLRLPVSVRLLMSFGIAIWLVDTWPQFTADRIASDANWITLAIGELLIGGTVALSLQLAFAAILWAGQVLDVQAGFGLAMIADPTTQAQMPLAGTIFAYTAAIIFFATGAHYDLLALWAAGVETLPLGFGGAKPDMTALGSFMGALFSVALGLVAIVLLVLFLLDMVIAFMSRTLPQMNVLLFGFQVKSIAMIVSLPVAMALSGGLFLRLIRLALTSAPQLLVVE